MENVQCDFTPQPQPLQLAGVELRVLLWGCRGLINDASGAFTRDFTICECVMVIWTIGVVVADIPEAHIWNMGRKQSCVGCSCGLV